MRICVFTSIFTHTEHAGAGGQAVGLRVSLVTIGLLGLGRVAMGGQGTDCFLRDTAVRFCAVGMSPVTACCRLCPLVAKVLWMPFSRGVRVSPSLNMD